MHSNVIKKISNGLLAGLLVSVLMACAGQKVAQEEPQDFGVEDATTAPSTVSLDKVKHTVHSVVHELWQKAEIARKSGDYEAAVTQLERALRIDPQDAVMWSRLAEIRLQQGNTNQAENLAAKSNAMTTDNPVLNYRNWLIIASARRLQGDDMGAQEAEYTAKTFIQN